MRNFVIRVAAFAATLLLVLEAVMRTAVPAADMPVGHQITEYGIMALDTTATREGHNTIGRLGRPRFRWHVNNDGFNSAWDFRPPGERNRPCAVVIGNSYVQGLYGDVEDHLAGQLQQATGGSLEFYNLGTSGMPLSQCLPVLDFARDRYRPELVVILASSLTRSLRDHGVVPLCRQFRWRDGELEALPPTTFRVNRRNRLIRRSALVRYLYYNANLNLGGGGDVVQARPAAEGEDPVLAKVLDRVMDELVEAADGAPLVMVYDAQRQIMYDTGSKPPRYAHSLLMEAACRERGIGFVDLTDTFWNDYRQHGRLLNFEDNYHWNSYAVGLAAGALTAEMQRSRILDDGCRWSPLPTR